MTTLSPPGRTVGASYKWWVVGMLWLISFFNYADRQAIFSVFPLLEREMGLTPVQLGLLGSSFAWVYGLECAAAPGWSSTGSSGGRQSSEGCRSGASSAWRR